ncbi:hypothetical protein TIFTF001_034373 [Ficus carica]|uniref:Uncharacterized protein n=1 Tax=Ficus carica TaxID=3494 RepID=A0AA88E7T0_FICCA|nr:hypothetical protein TIFTF001_034373 [Ficus carica]
MSDEVWVPYLSPMSDNVWVPFTGEELINTLLLGVRCDILPPKRCNGGNSV